MASPAPPPLQTLDTAAPSLIHGGIFDAVHNASVRVPTFRSGTLSIELPPHVRPFDWNDFSTMRPQAQQDVDHSDVRVAPVSSTSQSDTSTFLPFSLAQPGSSIVADRSDTADADEQEDTGAASQPIDPTPKLFRCAQRVQMRKDSHDKPRRLLTLHPSGFLSVTMRGSLDLVEQASLRYTPLRTSAGDGARQLVEDACVLHGTHKRTVVIGRAGNNGQLSLVRIEDGKVREIGSFERRSQAEKKGGISAVCAMMQPGIFATGGYDHLVNLWTLPNEGNAPPTPSAPLAIKHSSAIHSILPVRDTSHKLLTGSADCSLAIYDLSSERTVNALKLSNPVYHVHGVESPFCALLELGHREFQFEVRDYRLVPETPALRFGYSNTKVHGRYTRVSLLNTTPLKGMSYHYLRFFGLVIYAENALQAHEREERLRENKIRREARIALARRGLVATETEIAKWKEERARAMEAAAAETAQAAKVQASASEQ
uniref:Heterotrimeric G-protein beta subunit n=1 Tax=Ganoderma boninense TaxID=34458 RepID=A0A5K1JWS5_9APHY|nr:Heterotrimeric G-protein beta subunit [Ganoderma boninense]